MQQLENEQVAIYVKNNRPFFINPFSPHQKLVDAFKFAGISTTTSEKDIKYIGKRLLLVHHPDKGGNAQMFSLCRIAINVILKFKLGDYQETFENMKQDADTMGNMHSETQNDGYNPTFQNERFNLEKFNKDFDSMNEAYAEFDAGGYDKFNNNPEHSRMSFEEIDKIIESTKTKPKTYKKATSSLIPAACKDIYKKRQLGVYSMENYTDCVEKKNVYDKDLYMCDLMEAYEDPVDEDSIVPNPKYKNVNELLKEREAFDKIIQNQKYKPILTDEEADLYAEHEENKQRADEERLKRWREEAIYKINHYKHIHGALQMPTYENCNN